MRKDFRQTCRINTIRNAPEWRALEHSRTFAQILSQSLAAATLPPSPRGNHCSVFLFRHTLILPQICGIIHYVLFGGWLLFTQHNGLGFIPVAMDVSCSFLLIAELCAFVRTGRLCLSTLLLKDWAISSLGLSWRNC